MPQAYENTAVIFTVQIKSDSLEVDGWVGPDADEGEAFALCERLLGAVRDFNRADCSPGRGQKIRL